MKRIIALIALALTVNTSFAKKVKFAVDMDTFAISPNGIHVTGDFQTLAGYPGGDWTSNETVCAQEGSTTIYSVIVDIPAFRKYEYKFVNGDQFYEVEFVPIESRVGYDFNDNRWLWVDSLTNDTTFVGAIKFAGNAPAGLNLVRFLVNLNNLSTISLMPHLAGNFQNWNPATTSLYSFGDSVFEIINYLSSGSFEYKFINGNAWGVDESIPSACNVNGNRGITVSKDTVLSTFCFGTCNVCSPTLVASIQKLSGIYAFPNPSNESILVKPLNINSSTKFEIRDCSGRTLKSIYSTTPFRIFKNEFSNGLYYITRIEDGTITEVQKLIFY